MKRPAAAKDAATPAPASAEVIEVHGRVVDRVGRPVAGRRRAGRPSRRVHRAGPRDDQRAGRPVHPADPAALVAKVPGRTPDAPYPWVVASAPAFGPGWASAVRPPGGPGETTIELVEDPQVIVGRIVDLEGRPVVNARIGVDSIWFSREGGLAAWLDRVRDRDIEYRHLVPPPSDLHRHEGRSAMGIVGCSSRRRSPRRDREHRRRRPLPPDRDRPRPDRPAVRLRAEDRHDPAPCHDPRRGGGPHHRQPQGRADESRITVHPRLFECAVAPPGRSRA